VSHTCGPANGQTVHPQDAVRCAAGRAARRLTRLTVQPAEDVCKRRDAVRLGRIEAALPPGAGSGVLSGATVSWAAPRQFVPLTPLFLWSYCRRRHVDSRVAKQVAEPQSRSGRKCTCVMAGFFLEDRGAWPRCTGRSCAEAGTHGVLSGTASRPLTMLTPRAAVPGERTVSRAHDVPKLLRQSGAGCRCTAKNAAQGVSPRAEG
jgi:hypothetical protein